MNLRASVRLYKHFLCFVREPKMTAFPFFFRGVILFLIIAASCRVPRLRRQLRRRTDQLSFLHDSCFCCPLPRHGDTIASQASHATACFRWSSVYIHVVDPPQVDARVSQIRQLGSCLHRTGRCWIGPSLGSCLHEMGRCWIGHSLFQCKSLVEYATLRESGHQIKPTNGRTREVVGQLEAKRNTSCRVPRTLENRLLLLVYTSRHNLALRFFFFFLITWYFFPAGHW